MELGGPATVLISPLIGFNMSCVLYLDLFIKLFHHHHSLDCHKISDAFALETYLKELSQQPMKICRSLNLSSTCNELKNDGELKPFFFAEQYMKKTAKPCWENIVVMLCDVFEERNLAHTIAHKYDLDIEKLCTDYNN